MDKIFCKNLNVHDYLKSARFEMNIADLFFVSRETLSIGLKKVQDPPPYFPLQSIIFPRTITYTTDTIKVPQNGRKPPLSQFYDILPSFSLANIIGFISHEEKIKKEQMEEETFHNLQEIYIINTIMQENCCHPSWYRS